MIRSERDWPEDFSDENGNYTCTCCECKQLFIGHKRRVTCKVCATKEQPQGGSMTTPTPCGKLWSSDTPTPGAVPSEEFRIKRLREWAHQAKLRQPGASIIERTVAEDLMHLEAKYQRDLAASEAELASVKAERDALKRVHDDIMQAVDECGSYKP